MSDRRWPLFVGLGYLKSVHAFKDMVWRRSHTLPEDARDGLALWSISNEPTQPYPVVRTYAIMERVPQEKLIG